MQDIDANGPGSGRIARGYASLDLSGVDVIALSYLELTGSPAQLRYLVRRLRTRAPGARIIVGLWLQGEATLSDAQIQLTLGADRYVGSLAAAMEAVGDMSVTHDPQRKVAGLARRLRTAGRSVEG